MTARGRVKQTTGDSINGTNQLKAKPPVSSSLFKIIADRNMFIVLSCFRENKARQTIHMKSQALLSLKTKIKTNHVCCRSICCFKV